MPHIRVIDGLRALAVLAVIINHFGQGFPGGFLGVDVFFVISGFVITGQILRQESVGSFTFAEFYKRRIRRIVPALLLVVCSSLALGWFILTPSDYSALSSSAIAASFGFSNFYFLSQSGYFALPSRYFPLLHTWSLGIEEQFYLAWPVIVVFLLRTRKTSLAANCLKLALLSFVFAAWIGYRDSSAAFYLPFARAWELLIGCSLAFFRPAQDRAARRCMNFGVLFVIGSFIAINERSGLGALTAVPACIGTALLIAGREAQGSLVTKLFTASVPAFIGKVSYSLYLWHWPLMVFYLLHVGRPDLSLVEALCLLAISLALSAVSWWFIETPIRNSTGTRPILAIAASLVLLVTPISGVVVAAHGFPSRMSDLQNVLADGAKDFSKNRPACHRTDEHRFPIDSSCRYGANVDPDIAVWGDSHAVEVSEAIGQELSKLGHSLISVTYSSCPPAIGFASGLQKFCPEHNDEVMRFIVRSPHLKNILLVGYHDMHLATNAAAYLAGLEKTVLMLTGAGKRVIFLTPHPVPKFSVPQAAAKLAGDGKDVAELSVGRTEYIAHRKALLDFFEKMKRAGNVKVIDPIDAYCGRTICPFVANGKSLLFDTDHLSTFGASRVARQIEVRDLFQ